MANKTIIIVGGGKHSLGAAAKARQTDEHARIILIEQSNAWPSKKFWSHFDLGLSKEEVKLKINHSLDEFSKRYNIEIYRDCRAKALDVDARILVIKAPHKDIERLSYDSLAFAGEFLEGPGRFFGPSIFAPHTLGDLFKIKKAIKDGASHATITGLSLDGIRAALSLKKAGLKVSLIDQKVQIPEFSLLFLKRIFESLSFECELRINTSIIDVFEGDLGLKLKLSTGEMATDLLITCTPLLPKISLLADAGAAVDQNLIQVDDHLRTTLPNIYAFGPAISVPTVITGERQWMPDLSVALRTSQVAGSNAALKEGPLEIMKPSSNALVIKVGNSYFARTGLSEVKACQFFGADDVLVTTVHQGQISIRMMIDRKDQRIIGAEISGKRGVKRRIDLLSFAIALGLTPKRLLELDMVEPEAGFSMEPLKEAALRAHLLLSDKSQSISGDRLALLKAKNQGFSLVNVGEPDTKKAIHLPLEKLRERIAEMEGLLEPIILYSKNGYESFLAQQALAQRGLSQTYYLDDQTALELDLED